VPELPEVEALARYLDRQMGGRRVERAELAAVSALKTFDPPLEALVGREVRSVARKGKFLTFDLSDDGALWLVVHLARGGWIRWVDQLAPRRARPRKGPLAFRMAVEGGGGMEVTEAGTEKRLALWVVLELGEVGPLAELGADPLGPSFDRAAMERALEGERGQIKQVLRDQRVLAGIGNAYSDEILHAARLSPFKSAGRLTDEETARLFDSTVAILAEAVERSAGLPASGLKGEKRSGMRVHGRTGEACPVCGDTIREVAFAGRSLQYCPSCQTEGRVLADRRLSRLLR
jgi:formamidopyrimidine-DNA glycosylase